MNQESLTVFRNIDTEEDVRPDLARLSKYRNQSNTINTQSLIGRTASLQAIQTTFPPYDPKLQTVENVNSVIAVVQPNPKLSQKKLNLNETTMNYKQIDTEDNNPSVTQSNETTRLNISNILKNLYALKYNNKPSSSQASNLNQSEASSINSNPSQESSNSSLSSKQFWMPDEQVKECFQCNEKFTTFRRRHHCRVCGQIFCSKCSDYEIPSKLIWPNSTGMIRACTFCHSFVDEIEAGDIKTNSKSLKDFIKRLSLPTSHFYSFAGSSSELEQSQNKNYIEGSLANSLLSSYGSNSSISSLASNSQNASSSANLGLMINNSNNSQSQGQIISSNNANSTATFTIGPPEDNNPFDVTEHKDYFRSQDVEIKQLIINNSSELRNLWIQLYHTSDGVQFTTKNINKFKKISNSITGKELVDWLIKSKSVSKDQAIVIGQALMDGKWLECSYQNASNSNSINSLTSYYSSSNNSNKVDQIFYDDNTYYRPGPTAFNYNRDDNLEEKKSNVQDTEEGPEWIKELNKLINTSDDDSVLNSVSTTSLSSIPNISQKLEDTDSTTSSIPIIKIQNKAIFLDEAPLSNQTIISSGTSSLSSSPNTSLIPTRTQNNVNDNLQQVHKQIQIEILKQLLKVKNISFDWFDIIIDLAWRSVDLVKPDVKHDNDSMDIRSYIKIKKLIGSKTDSKIINGLVFSKNLAHKQMNKEIKNPKVLLLRSSIEYQRTEDAKMCSLEPIFTAESQYLKNYCSKLLIRHNPDILVVEKSVARIAQEIFLQSNVSLVLNVKSTIMEKLCRFLQADPMHSIDDPVRKPKLGFCSKFHIDNYLSGTNRNKSLMFFEGTPTNLGCTILLFGSSETELSAVKSLIKFMIFVAYNSKLEQSFVLDKYADFEMKNIQFEFKNEDEFRIEKNLKKEDLNKLDQKQEDEENKPKLNLKPILVDENPLELVKSQIEEESIVESETQDSENLKLKICEQHKEKSSNNLNRNFKLLLDDLVLSCSPFIKFQLPFLMNESHTDSLRKYLPQNYMNYLKSNILLLDSQSNLYSPISVSSSQLNQTQSQPDLLHDFLLMHLTKSFDDSEIKKLYADYKSRGGIAASSSNKRLILKKIEKLEEPPKSLQYDCLDIFNRQHLAVLFVTQCETSPVYPNMCHKPRIINMKFYSENDMTLGNFLAKNCFRNGYKCNNDLCDTLVVFHTRSFIHADSKITVRMSIVPTANLIQPNNHIQSASGLSLAQNQSETVKSSPNNTSILSIASLIQPKQNESQEKKAQILSKNQASPVQTQNLQPPQAPQQPVYDDINIFMWSVCKICNKSTKKVAMSPDTWSFSLAKFLELTLHAKSYHQFNSNNDSIDCKHSLFQDHYQYFRFKNIVTVFSTSKINIKNILLPDIHLKFLYPAKTREAYIEETKDLYDKGLSLFQTLIERLNTLKAINLNEKQIQKLDQFIQQISQEQTLKNKIEKINLSLTQNSSHAVNYEAIDLLVIDVKKYIANSALNWNNKMNEFFKKSKFDDEGTTSTDNPTTSNPEPITGKQLVNETPESGLSLLNESKEIEMTDEHKISTSAISIGKRLIANFIPSSAYQPLKIPFLDEEHFVLSSESNYYVTEKYLSSIVAFSLTSKEYKEFQLNSSKIDSNKLVQQTQQNHNQELDEFENNIGLSKSTGLHFELQFHDSTTKFYCKAYHAESFQRLRKVLLPNEEERYINSLFRCINWEAKGGKSNSQFRKTLDNRFIIKEMSKQEVQSFLDFAPQYIEYVIDSTQNKKATALAKIYGAYRICMMKSTSISSKAVKIDVIVMENLFYSKKCTQIFDLKGSERNRLIHVNNQTNKQQEKDLVLLDENFLRWTFDNPIYVKPHAKHVLMKAIENDTTFLASKFVMDYSLLFGYDPETNEISVGIIDYLRVFTWDKKLETYIKTISGQGKMPTIVSPEVYKTRFFNAIDRYFLEVPDQWYQDNLN